jgi:L-ascorbate metabolism protein UlaG (beta-lactamase superfamily)
MALINEIHQPEIGIVPIGDRYTMGGRTAAMACRRFFNFRTIVPCHYGTFPGLARTADEFLASMGPEATRVLLLARGEAVEL